jgi:hypothetical protein
VEDEPLERVAALRHDEQADGGTPSRERLLDRTATGNELLIRDQLGGVGLTRAPWPGTRPRPIEAAAGSGWTVEVRPWSTRAIEGTLTATFERRSFTALTATAPRPIERLGVAIDRSRLVPEPEAAALFVTRLGTRSIRARPTRARPTRPRTAWAWGTWAWAARTPEGLRSVEAPTFERRAVATSWSSPRTIRPLTILGPWAITLERRPAPPATTRALVATWPVVRAPSPTRRAGRLAPSRAHRRAPVRRQR